MKILIYSFEKFDKLQSNPAAIVGEKLAKSIKEKCHSKFIQLETTFNSWELLEKEIIGFQPDFILGIGVAPNRPRISIENIALNIIHASKPDNKGNIIENKKIINNSPLAYETTIDSKKLLKHFNQNQVPAELSFSADTYVCNYTYYNCLNYCNKKETKTIFLHIPLSPEEVINLNANLPSFPLDKIAGVLSVFLEYL